MISIKKDFALAPTTLTTAERDTSIKQALTEKNTHKFKSKIYRDSTLIALETLYQHKCAYCETDTTAGAPMQVEHYRPKAKVTEAQLHEGYYWVGYEWSNLLLSCSKCNNKKRNHFPIAGVRVSTPALNVNGLPDDASRLANSPFFLNEQPLLLHPEIDPVEDFFIFKPDGKIEALNNNPRAIETIKTCNLNRKDLIIKRLKILNGLFNEIQLELKELAAGTISTANARHSIKRIFQKIFSLQNTDKEYSRFGYFLFTKFDNFFTERFPTAQQQDAVRKLFQLFLKGQL
jgi:uncharacterized protein (TIGR02646 family)